MAVDNRKAVDYSLDMSKTINLSGLTKFISDEIAAGRLGENPEIRISTEWEGAEHLDARAEVVSDDGPAYILLRQA